MKLRTVCFALGMSAAMTAHAIDTPLTAKVMYAGTYGDGRLFVALDTQINEPGCAQPRFDVPTGHSQIKTWLGIALTAATSGKSVVVKTAGCYGGMPTMGQAWDSWFYLQSN